MRILLIEDEQRLADALTRGMAADGIAVEHVTDGIVRLAQGTLQASTTP